jgi:DNA polymerase-3 subunit chi
MKVDFHILDKANGQQSLLYACNIIEQAYTAGQQVFVQTGSKEEAQRLDNLLWTYSDTSFIPHSLYSPGDMTAVQIGYEATPPQLTSLLVNLSTEMPAFYNQFSHIIEIVFSDPHVQQLARNRFRQYRDQGCEITTKKDE